jgi:hypothetical protein
VGTGNTTSPGVTTSGYTAQYVRYDNLQLGLTVDYDIPYTLSFDLIGGGAEFEAGTVTKSQLASVTKINIIKLQPNTNYYVYLKYSGNIIFTSPTPIFSFGPFGYFLSSRSRISSTHSKGGYFTFGGDYAAATNLQTPGGTTMRSFSTPTSNVGIFAKVDNTTGYMDINDSLTVVCSGHSQVKNSEITSTGKSVFCGKYTGAGYIKRDSTNLVTLGSGTNGFVSVFDDTNNHIFTRLITASDITINSVTMDSFGNVYVIGSYYGTLYVYDNTGTTLLGTGYTKGGTSRAGFIVKFGSTGTYQYMRAGDNYDNTSSIIFNDVKCDSSGNVYTIGKSTRDIAILNETGAQLTRIFSGQNSSFSQGIILKLGSDGTYIDSRMMYIINSSTAPDFFCIDVDSSDNIYICGAKSTQSTIKFKNHNGDTNTISTLSTMTNGILLSFTQNFTLSWILTFGGVTALVNMFPRTISFPYIIMDKLISDQQNIGVYDNSGTLVQTIPRDPIRSGYILKFTTSGTVSSSRISYTPYALNVTTIGSSRIMAYHGNFIYTIFSGSSSVDMSCSTSYNGVTVDNFTYTGGEGLKAGICRLDPY